MCLIEFMNVFRAGLFAFDDWNGSDDQLDATVEKIFQRGPNGDETVAWVKDTLQLAKDAAFNKHTSRPITIEEVAKAKIVIDLYINLKAREFMPSTVAESKKETETKEAESKRNILGSNTVPELPVRESLRHE